MESTALARRVLRLLDATDLADTADAAGAWALCRRAIGEWGRVAGICVWPDEVATVRTCLAELLPESDGVPVVTVANFPSGDGESADVVRSVSESLAAGADEIDVVLPYRAFIDGDRSRAAIVIDGVRAVTEGHVMKVILETGELVDPALISDASLFAIEHGADFLKTSSGKTAVSATPEAVHILLEAVREADRPVGVKVSGGVRTMDDAMIYIELVENVLGEEYVDPRTFRIGASSLLDVALAELRA